jgi:glycerol-3-phosphate dehydrogenase (NAD(P)+)
MAKVAVIGATTWGNSIGMLLAQKKVSVNILARTEAKARELGKKQQERVSSTGFPDCVLFTGNATEALHDVAFVICAVPAQSMRQSVKGIRDYVTPSMILISLAKGLEAESGKRMSEVIADEVVAGTAQKICVLSGPNLSKEIDQGLPATSVAASPDIRVAQRVQALLDSPMFSVFVSDDIVGVEVCGALKNVIALGAGIFDGLKLGNNAKAAFIAIGWSEVVSLGMALGANQATFWGLAGLGDLIATGNSPLSRNHYVGYELGRGRSLADVMASMPNVAEGIDTTMAAHCLTAKLGLKLPTITMVYRVLFESLTPAELASQLRNGIEQ